MRALSVAVVLALLGCGGCCGKKSAHLVPKERATAEQIRRSAEQVDSNAPERRLETALFAIYRNARAVAGLSDHPPESPSVVEAARTIDELSPKLGDFWRMLAVVKLGAVGLDKAEFREAIQILKVEPRKLDELFSNRPTDRYWREQSIFAFLREIFQIGAGIPSCDTAYPTSSGTVDPTNASAAIGTASVDLKLTVAQLAVAADPQNWDNTCAQPFFQEAYVATVQGATFPQKPGDPCEATERTSPPPPSPGTQWQDYLFERFLVPYTFNFFTNVLAINKPGEARPACPPGQYCLHYELETSICAQVGTVSTSGALWTDEGGLTARDIGGGWIHVDADKRVGFNDRFTPYTPQQMANDAATRLEMMGNALPYWLCCPG